MKRLFAVETKDGIFLIAKRTKTGATSELNKARRKGVKVVIREYVSK